MRKWKHLPVRRRAIGALLPYDPALPEILPGLSSPLQSTFTLGNNLPSPANVLGKLMQEWPSEMYETASQVNHQRSELHSQGFTPKFLGSKDELFSQVVIRCLFWSRCYASEGDRAAAWGSLNLMRRQPASKQFPIVITSKGGSGRETGCTQAVRADLSEVTF